MYIRRETHTCDILISFLVVSFTDSGKFRPSHPVLINRLKTMSAGGNIGERSPFEFTVFLNLMISVYICGAL